MNRLRSQPFLVASRPALAFIGFERIQYNLVSLLFFRLHKKLSSDLASNLKAYRTMNRTTAFEQEQVH